MKSAIALKERLQRKQLTTGMIVTHHLWLELLEIAQFAGMDYVIVDLEHTGHDNLAVADACRIGRMTDFPVLIRPPRTDAESIRLAVDLGPCGLLLPMIQTAAQLDEVRDGLFMPPRGERRPGGHGNWWVSDFNHPTWREMVEQHFVILPQIESPQGIENVSAIAAHELTTAMAIGPYDLSARLGVCFNPDAPSLIAATRKIRAAADANGKSMWVIGDGQQLQKQGFHFLCVAEPMYLLRTTLKNMIDQLRHGKGLDADKAFVP